MLSSNLNMVDLHIKQALIFKSLIVFFLLKNKQILLEPGVIQDVLAAGSHLQLLELLNLCSHYLIQVCELASCYCALPIPSPAVISCTRCSPTCA